MTNDHRRGRARVAFAWDHGFGVNRDRVLAAAGGAYRSLLGAREWLYRSGVLHSRAVECPVVSVGNVTVGGTGKTPAVEVAVQTLVAMGRRPGIVSRGYGRRSRGIQVVADAAAIRLDAEDGGDEPFLLARRLPGIPIVVGENRYQAARHILDRFGVTAIVLDDGFQHRTLAKDLEIVMARARSPWGNGRVLPAGPLREPFAALQRAHLVVVTGATAPDDTAEVTPALRQHAPNIPVLAASYAPTECWEWRGMQSLDVRRLAGMRLLAFAGIGAPAGFGRTLGALGAVVEELVAFADHHWYSRQDLAVLDQRADRLGADGLVTTEKDWVRLRALPPPRIRTYVLGVKLLLLSGDAVWRAAFERACTRG